MPGVHRWRRKLPVARLATDTHSTRHAGITQPVQILRLRTVWYVTPDQTRHTAVSANEHNTFNRHRGRGSTRKNRQPGTDNKLFYIHSETTGSTNIIRSCHKSPQQNLYQQTYRKQHLKHQMTTLQHREYTYSSSISRIDGKTSALRSAHVPIV